MPIYLSIQLLLLAAGIWLLIRGWLGYRKGDHPICRRCGFDLYGKPVGTVVCGECGAHLSDRGAVAIGHQHRRKDLLYAGSVMIVLFGCLLMPSILDINWMGYAPTWLVTWRAGSSDKAARSSALAELKARLTNNTLSANDLQRIADAGLAYQSNLAKKWDTGWGDLLELEQAKGKLSAEQWKQYAAQTWPGTRQIRVRPRVRLGDPLYYWFDTTGGRTSSTNNWMLQMNNLQVRWPGIPDVVNQNPTSWGSNLQMSGSTGGQIEPTQFPPGIKPGLITVHIVADITVAPPVANPSTAQPLASGQLDLPATFTLCPADQPSVAIVHDPSLATAIKNSLSIESVGLSYTNDCTIKVDGPPVGLGFDIFLRKGATERKIGMFACPAGTTNHAWSTGTRTNMNLMPGQTIDVILRGNPAAAVVTTDTFQAWDGEIVFKDVPVK